MKRELLWVAAGAAALAVVQGCGRAQAQNAAKEETPREVQLTIYKDDFSLVHETRPVELSEGRTRLQLDRVSKTLDPNSVIFDWPKASGADVVSETYDLGVASGASLLKRLEGRPVEMLWNTQDGRPHDKIEGVLEASQDGGFVIRSGDKLYVNPNGTIVASGEASLVTLPRLSVEVDSKSRSSDQLGFTYQTRGMSWSSDYVGRLTPDGDALELECWATLENHTGIDFPNAKITLVAGSPNRAAMAGRARAQLNRMYEFQATAGTSDQDSSGFGLALPQAVGELYAYNVPAAASVGQEQMNRVKMMAATRVPVKKDYSIRLDNALAYEYGYGDTNPHRQNAQLAISLINDEKSGLGLPLPGGAVRLYDASSSDATAFVGAANLGDTPKNQHVHLTLSKVFDVYSDSRTKSSVKVGKRTVRRTFETVLHNEKKSAVDVRLVQGVYGQWKLVSESDKGRKINAGTFQRTIHLDPGQQRTVTWTADFAV